MKLLRYGPAGQEKPGILDAAGAIRDLSGVVPDITGDVLSPAALAKIAAVDVNSLPKVAGNPRLGSPVTGMKNLICIGLNYADHAAETGAPIPKEPIVFLKSLNALQGPNDDVVIPRGSVKTDYEVELCIIIGTRGKVYSALQDKAQRNVFFAPATKHSSKPEALQDILDLMFPDPDMQRLELFGRRNREGWTVIGNEAPDTLGEDVRASLVRLAA